MVGTILEVLFKEGFFVRRRFATGTYGMFLFEGEDLWRLLFGN
jgi:hypothetical protein